MLEFSVKNVCFHLNDKNDKNAFVKFVVENCGEKLHSMEHLNSSEINFCNVLFKTFLVVLIM